MNMFHVWFVKVTESSARIFIMNPRSIDFGWTVEIENTGDEWEAKKATIEAGSMPGSDARPLGVLFVDNDSTGLESVTIKDIVGEAVDLFDSWLEENDY
ncbi:MAG: hypothetical protein ABIH41_04950 [Nanoarchaeota archaeon]